MSANQMPNPLEFHKKRGFVESAPKTVSVPIIGSELSSVRHGSPQHVDRARDASAGALPTLNSQTPTQQEKDVEKLKERLRNKKFTNIEARNRRNLTKLTSDPPESMNQLIGQNT